MPTRRLPLLNVAVVFVFLCAAVCQALPLHAQHGGAASPPQHDAAAQPTAGGAQPVEHDAADDAHGSEHAVRDMIARLLNFGILVAVIVYFLRAPIAGYLTARSTQIRQDLVTAAETRAAANTQLEEIKRQLSALPAELEGLKARGEEDVRAEQARIAGAAAAERERLLEQTRREIAMRLRMARRELTQHAAELAVGVAEQRIKRNITPEDQLRLVDRYTTQLKEAR